MLSISLPEMGVQPQILQFLTKKSGKEFRQFSHGRLKI